jgi:hypothetical protein
MARRRRKDYHHASLMTTTTPTMRGCARSMGGSKLFERIMTRSIRTKEAARFNRCGQCWHDRTHWCICHLIPTLSSSFDDITRRQNGMNVPNFFLNLRKTDLHKISTYSTRGTYDIKKRTHNAIATDFATIIPSVGASRIHLPKHQIGHPHPRSALREKKKKAFVQSGVQT